jgi:hypothetical protein
MNRSTEGLPCQTVSSRIPSIVICSAVFIAFTEVRSLTAVSDCPANRERHDKVNDSINILIDFRVD